MKLPLVEADAKAHEQIEHHRAEMARWRMLRAQRVAAELDAGRTVAQVAAELGVHVDVVYKLRRQARAG
jgi:transposase-like protein